MNLATLLVSALALAMLSACENRAVTQPPSEEEQIAEFCNRAAADFMVDPATRGDRYLMSVQQKMLEEEWDPEVVTHICGEALDRKRELMYGTTSPSAG